MKNKKNLAIEKQKNPMTEKMKDPMTENKKNPTTNKKNIMNKRYSIMLEIRNRVIYSFERIKKKR